MKRVYIVPLIIAGLLALGAFQNCSPEFLQASFRVNQNGEAYEGAQDPFPPGPPNQGNPGQQPGNPPAQNVSLRFECKKKDIGQLNFSVKLRVERSTKITLGAVYTHAGTHLTSLSSGYFSGLILDRPVGLIAGGEFQTLVLAADLKSALVRISPSAGATPIEELWPCTRY